MKTLKGLLKSKTFWVNLLSIIVLVLGELNGKEITQYTVYAIAISNIVLRFLTNKPLNEK